MPNFFRGTSMLRQFLYTCFFSYLIALPAQAMSVLPMYLDEIVNYSAIAFQGKVLENHSEREFKTGSIVTYTTFEVQDVLKGEVGAVHTIKQIGGSLPGEIHQALLVPTFKVGQGYIVFLAGISDAGFSSPIGLDQGKFDIVKDSKGINVSNGRDFKEMTLGIVNITKPSSVQSKIWQTPGPVKWLDINELKELVREQTGASK